MNKNNRKKIKQYIDICKTKEIKFICKDFRKIDIDNFNDVEFVYADPPYLITDAVYNENAGWGKKEEKDLLDRIGRNGYQNWRRSQFSNNSGRWR